MSNCIIKYMEKIQKLSPIVEQKTLYTENIIVNELTNEQAKKIFYDNIIYELNKINEINEISSKNQM